MRIYTQVIDDTLLPQQQQISFHCGKTMTKYLDKALQTQHMEWLMSEFPSITALNALIESKCDELKQKLLEQKSNDPSRPPSRKKQRV